MIAATAFLIMYFEFVKGGGKHRDEVLGVPLQAVYDVLVEKAPPPRRPAKAPPARRRSTTCSASPGSMFPRKPPRRPAPRRAGSAILKMNSWKPEAVRAQLVDRLIVVARTAGIYVATPDERTEAFEAAVRGVAGPEWQAEFMLPAGVGPETVWNVCETVLVGEKLMEPPSDGGSGQGPRGPAEARLRGVRRQAGVAGHGWGSIRRRPAIL